MSYQINFDVELLKNIEIIDSDTNSQEMSNQIRNMSHNSPVQLNGLKLPKITYIIEPKGAKFEEAKRVIAIAYSYTCNKVRYGASIFRKDYKNESCVKSQIRTTAMERFVNCPIYFMISKENISTHKHVVDEIRYLMHYRGVQSKQSFEEQVGSEISEENSQENSQENSKENLQKHQKNNTHPLISYILEPKNSDWGNATRIIAIVYSYDNDTIKYGASIFRRLNSKETCLKTNIRNTAMERFYNSPLTIDLKQLSHSLHIDDKVNKIRQELPNIVNTIRKFMYSHGVKNKYHETKQV